jgi:transposase
MNTTNKNWFNEKGIKKIQKKIPFPEKYKINKNIDNNFKNILSDVKYKKKIKLFNLEKPDQSENDELIRTYKYKINFTGRQHIILQSYFKECNYIYNLCVDIYKLYPEMTDNWMILKDAIFDIVYREENNKEDFINLIIIRLKKDKETYDIENEKNQNIINELKQKEKDKFKLSMEQYKQKVLENKNSSIKLTIKKPRMNKIKIEKIKNPRKPNRKATVKPAPVDTLKSEIKYFCSNLKSTRTNLFNNNIKIFSIEYKDIKDKQTIYLSNNAINKNGIFINSLKKMECYNFNKLILKYNIDKECKLMYDKRLNNYYLYIVNNKEYKNIQNRKEIVALDQGEKIFISYYSNNEIGNIGNNMRVFILKQQIKIKKLQSILNKNKNKNNKSIKNKKTLKKKILKLYSKIKGYVNEIHKKSALYLCKNYENIILPTFEIKNMISNNKIKKETKRIKELNKEDGKKEIKKLSKLIKLSKNVKFVLSMQSHYRFKEYLKAKAKEYKTNIYDADESYTSLTCTKCGEQSKEYNKQRIKQCKCGYEIDRDCNGSRNILLKCLKNLIPV